MSLGKTHKSREWGEGNHVGAFVCVRGVLSIGRHFFILDLLIGWQINGMWGYLLFERFQGVQTAWMNTFYIYFVFGIITISTTRVDFVCFQGLEYNIIYCH